MEEREELWSRLAILEESGLISSRAVSFCRQAMEQLLEKRPEMEDEKAGMFLTHLAMASQRALEGREEEPLGEEVLCGIIREAIYPEAKETASALLSGTDIPFSKTEQDYLVVHLCNLFT